MATEAKNKLLILNPNLFVDTIKNVLKDKCEYLLLETADSREATIEKAKQCNAIISDANTWNILMRGQTADDIVANAKNLKLFALASIGYDALAKHFKGTDVKITNSPNSCEYAVAEYAVGMTIAALRRFEEGRRAIDDNGWKQDFLWNLGHDIQGSTIGIVGFGQIGQKVAKILRAMDPSRILYLATSRKPEVEQQLSAELATFDELLKQSDVVIACIPQTPATTKMFNEEAFKKMKKTAVFINMARGGVVDQDALVKALKENWIFGASLDVMTPEPLPPDHELTKLPNCFLQPHMGSGSVNARKLMIEVSARNVLALFENKPLISQVHF